VHLDELLPPIERAIAVRHLNDLATAFMAADVPHAIVNDHQDAVRDAHVAAVDGVAWQSLEGLPDLPLGLNDRRAQIPALDGDRAEILAELNFE
jgi:crotonobetainyl-CoA:carnitine CoA-transferase CaiB-like acyl-CoA transferase